MQNPLVSIIIPVYNAAPGLARCIESVRKQTYSAIEILLIDDGSIDASHEICQMYARVDSRVKVITKENSGVSSTRNLAIEIAEGTYFQFVDSDDYLTPDATQLLVERAVATEADLVLARYYRVDGEKITEYGFLDDTAVLDKTTFARELMDAPASFYYGVLWNKLYRADIIRRYEIVCNESLQWSEDFLFNLEFIRYAERFCAMREPVYYYVRNKKSITHTQMNLPSIVRTKSKLFTYYKDLYNQLGLYEKYKDKAQIFKYLISTAEHP